MSNSSKGTSTGNLATQPVAPTRFRCKVGGEWKPLSSFSNNQQRMIQRQIDSRRHIDAAHSGMTCRDHTSGARTELQCGICGLTKHADEYSRSSRRNGVYHCKRCVAWVETQEPDVTPAPLETGHISVEEERQDVWQTNYAQSTDFFADDMMPQAPITAMASLGLQDLDTPSGIDVNALISEPRASISHSVDGASSGVSTVSSGQKPLPLPRRVPPHLIETMGVNKTTSGKPSNSSATGISNSSTSVRSFSGNNLPPHLLPKNKMAQPAATSDAVSQCSGSVSTATTVREEKADRKHRLSFNAWDASGNQHRGLMSATATSASATTSDTGDEETDGLENAVSCYQQVQRGRSKWPKTGDTRLSQTELRKLGGNHHVVARTMEPVIDRQCQYNVASFCEPDEDDDLYDA